MDGCSVSRTLRTALFALTPLQAATLEPVAEPRTTGPGWVLPRCNTKIWSSIESLITAPQPMSPLQLAQAQFEAYNAHDLAAFIACYSDRVQVFRPPAPQPTLDGKTAFAAFYQTQRFNQPGLCAELLNRVVLGHTVIDHERIHGLGEQPLEMAVVYRVQDGLIHTVHAFPA